MAATKRERQAKAYGERLRAALNETGTTVYRLARQINPQSPESARSNLQRYLRGAVLPGAESRYELAHALGRPELLREPGDEDEEDDLASVLERVIHTLVDRRLEQREKVA